MNAQSGAIQPPRNTPGHTPMKPMPDPSGNDPDIYRLLFEQTPRIIQWVLGVLTLGLFSIAAWAWRAQTRNVERVERQVHERMDRVENNLNQRMDRVENNLNQRMDEMNHHLIEIANNTRKQ